MSQATEFLWVCLGSSTLLVSTAGSLWMLGFGRKSSKSSLQDAPTVPRSFPVQQAKVVLNEDLPGTPDHAGLAKRLQEFQHARYASPIVQRVVDPARGPAPHQLTVRKRQATIPPPAPPPRREDSKSSLPPPNPQTPERKT